MAQYAEYGLKFLIVKMVVSLYVIKYLILASILRLK